MATWTVLVWNMALGSPPARDAGKNWKHLEKLITDESVDVALLNEAAVRPKTEIIYGTGGTQGRDGVPRAWSTAIVSKHGPLEIHDARPSNYLGHPRKHLPFENSRPGSWTAAVVGIPRVGSVTCVALYGLLDDLSDASVHRSLTELDPIFSDKRYNQRIVLGGDLNLSTQLPIAAGYAERAQAVLDRMGSLGQVNCLGVDRRPLKGCPCRLEKCTHVRTTWNPRAKNGGKPFQMDYLFASRQLVEDGGLVRCEPLDRSRWGKYSDHAPIVATFSTTRFSTTKRDT